METQILELIASGETLMSAILLVASLNLFNRIKNKLNLDESKPVEHVLALLELLSQREDISIEDSRNIVNAAEKFRKNAFSEFGSE